MIKLEPNQIWEEYQKGVEYLSNRDIFNIVQQNEDFYDGRQWEGVEAKGLPKPVVNFLKPVVKHMVSTIASNDVAISMTPYTKIKDDIAKMTTIQTALENLIEQDKLKEKTKELVRDGGVDGQGFILSMFNPNLETGQEMKGRVESTIVDITQTIFGNPYSKDIQNQPYIIIGLRQHISQVKKEARQMGISEDKIELISPDNDDHQANDDSDELVTVLLKFFKKTSKEIKEEVIYDEDNNPIVIENEEVYESVWFTRCTKDLTLIKETDLEYKRYPLCCFGWDSVKNSYLYNSPMTEVIPNQIFVNKCYALAEMYGQQSAFPKIVYDKSKVDIEKFLNSTSPTATAGIDLMGKYLDFIKIPDFSGNIIELAQDMMKQTKECMGINDATLGNVRPDNAQAIIALQESSTVPLEIQRGHFFEMWEDLVRNILDIMSVTYGVRELMNDDNEYAIVDFSVLKEINYDLKVDIGTGSQFSEIAQISTQDKLFQAKIIDPETYIESIPRKYLFNKNQILDRLRQGQIDAMQQAQQMALPIAQEQMQ